MKSKNHSPYIAVIGLAGRFPDAPDIRAFWRNLEQGLESLVAFTDAELAASGIDPKYLDDPNFVKKGTYLEGADLFDAAFFALNPREAEILDPQQRVFLECAWEAMEDAGYLGDSGAGRVGVFAGSSMNSYFFSVLANNPALLDAVGRYQLMIGNDKDFLATRVSYKLDLKGPSVTIQTACSTSLVAVQIACQSLQSGQCDMALAGGVSVHFPQKTGHLYVPGMIFSPDGHCRPFDARAGGIRGGAGAGIAVLKRLDDALREGDSIRAVILGAAVNNDGGAKMGYTAPSVEGQAAAIQAALEAGGVDPASISYVEAHGTATAVGDPIEIAALERVFRPSRDQNHFCAIGSVKSNIGHLDAAAGVAGLIKTVLALENKRIPASLNFHEPNPRIDFAHSPFFVNDRCMQWDSTDGPRRAGVSSFGIGGSNAHVVLEEAPAAQPSVVLWPAQLLALSARSASALEAASASMAAHLGEQSAIDLADACYTTQVGRKRFAHRRIVISSTREEAVKALSTGDRRKVFTRVDETENRPVTLMFTGQGSQHVGMAHGLYEFQPVFRREFDYCAEKLAPEIGYDLREILFSPSADPDLLNQTKLAQPALFSVEYALARMWMSWGVKPDSAIGHSIGEYVAACLAGVFSIEDALRVVAARGRIMQAMPTGGMLAVRLSEGELRPFLDGRISIAAVNSPSACTLSGSDAGIAALHARLEASGIESRLLHTSHAFHSSAMDEAVEIFRETLRSVELRELRLPFLSNVTGRQIAPNEATNPDYWAQHLRQTVRFADGIRELASPGRLFLEVGPGQTLAAFADDITRGVEGSEVFASLPHPSDSQSDPHFILKTLAKLWLAGVTLDWKAVHAGERLHRVSLPTYPFERERFWGGTDSQASLKPAASLPARSDDISDWFYAPSWSRSVMPSLTVAGLCAGSWVIFEDAGPIAGFAARELSRLGETFVRVKKGSSFAHVGEQSYTIDPARAEDYLRLLTETAATPHILFLWGLDGARDAFRSLLFLAQAFGDRGNRGPVDYVIVSAEMHSVTGREAIDPEQALLSGPCKVIPLEYPNVRCRSVDICRHEMSPVLVAELLLEPATPHPFKSVAYRDGWRWQQTFEPVRLLTGRPQIRRGGVYLITGGLGGIGLSLATHLAETCGARLALISRSSLPDRDRWRDWLVSHDEADECSVKIRAVERIEALGGEVALLSADVCDRTAMKQALDKIHLRFGPVTGVIHAAGVVGPGLMQLKTMDAVSRVLESKVEGTLVLDSLLSEEPLDFFVLCSSIVAIVNIPGTVDYTSANAFLDAFAASRNRRKWPLVTSINWDSWQEVGMAVKSNAPRGSGNQNSALTTAIKPAEGVEAFERALASRLSQVAVITRDLPQMLALLERTEVVPEPSLLAAIKQNVELHPRQGLSSDYAPPETETQRRLVEIWKNQFGIEAIGIDDNFFDLGGHSLLATAVLARIGQAFDLSVPPRIIFDAPTVRGLSEYVDNLVWASLGPLLADAGLEDREEIEL